MKRFCFLILLIASTVTVKSQLTETLLWKIEGEQLSKPSYLFGTVHFKDKRLFNFNDSVLVALDACDAFAMEVELNASNIQQIVDAMQYESTTLDQQLSEKAYAEVGDYFKEVTGNDINHFQKYKPFMIASMLSKPSEEKHEQAPFMVDAYLYNVAQEKNKKVLSVEELATQIELFDSFGEKELVASVEKLQENPNSILETTEQIIVAYSEEKINDLESLVIEDQAKGLKDFYKKMFSDRNITMTESIQSMIADESVFIAIGAGHLVGKNGVIKLLQKEGFTVTPVVAPRTQIEDFGVEEKELVPTLVETEHFKVEFFNPPVENMQVVATEVGEMTIATYMLEASSLSGVNNMLYSMGYVVYPEGAKDHLSSPESIKEAYDNAVAESVKAFDGEIVDQKDILFRGLPARLALESADKLMPNTSVEVIYVYNQGIMYFLQVGFNNDALDEAEKQQFYDSFEFLLAPEVLEDVETESVEEVAEEESSRELEAGLAINTLAETPEVSDELEEGEAEIEEAIIEETQEEEAIFEEEDLAFEEEEALVETEVYEEEIVAEKPSSGFMIQFGYFSSNANAESRKSALEAIGVSTSIMSESGNYRVYLGGFNSFQESDEQLDNLKNSVASWPEGDVPFIKLL